MIMCEIIDLERKKRLGDAFCGLNLKKKGNFYSAYPCPSGRLWALRAECVTRVTRKTEKLNKERSRTTTSCRQQQTKRKVNSLLPLGFEPVSFGMLAHLSNDSAVPLCRVVVTTELPVDFSPSSMRHGYFQGNLAVLQKIDQY
jgi:hypothetical protein